MASSSPTTTTACPVANEGSSASRRSAAAAGLSPLSSTPPTETPGRIVSAAAMPIAAEMPARMTSPARSVAPKPMSVARRAGGVATGRISRPGRVTVVMGVVRKTADGTRSFHDRRLHPAGMPDVFLRFLPPCPSSTGRASESALVAGLSQVALRIVECPIWPGTPADAILRPPSRSTSVSWCATRLKLRIPRGKNGPNLEGRAHALRTQARAPVTPPPRRQPPNAERGEDARPAGIRDRPRAGRLAMDRRQSPPPSAPSTRPPRRASFIRTTPRAERAA